MSEQLPFTFDDVENDEFSFIMGAENELAIKWLKNWPDWPSKGGFLNIFGPGACGKSRLGRIHQKRTGAQLLTGLRDWHPDKITNQHIILDEIELSDNWSEEALFFLYQTAVGNSGTILFLSTKPISSLQWKLADLRSRFRSIVFQEILPLSETLVRPLLEHHFTQRQCAVTQTVLNYIEPRVLREYSYIQQLVIQLDKASLKQKQPITIALVKRVFEEFSGESI